MAVIYRCDGCGAELTSGIRRLRDDTPFFERTHTVTLANGRQIHVGMGLRYGFTNGVPTGSPNEVKDLCTDCVRNQVYDAIVHKEYHR